MADEVLRDEFFEEVVIEEFEEEVEEVAAPPPASKKPQMEKALRWVIIVALIILAGELVMILIINPCLPLSKIEVVGMPELDKAMVIQKGGITARSSFASVNVHSVEKRLRELPAVKNVRVTKRFPDTVRIDLEGRRAIAMSLGMVDNKVYPVFYDRQGLVFMIGNEGSGMHRSIPIISGILVEEPYLGMRLPASFSSLLHDLEDIRMSSPELLAALSEIRINRNVFDRYDLTLFPVHNKVRIRVGTELTENILRYALLVVDVCVSKGVSVEEIDFRTGTASYTIKEASSG